MFPSLFFSNSLRKVPAFASHCKTSRIHSRCEVELVSFEDDNCELDGETPISQISMMVKSINAVILNIHFLGRCQRSRRPPTTLSLCQASRDAAPPVQHCVDFTCAWFITELLHAVKLITTPCSENSGKRLRGRSHKMIGIPIGVWPNHLRSREVDWLNRVIRIIIISRMFCSG